MRIAMVVVVDPLPEGCRSRRLVEEASMKHETVQCIPDEWIHQNCKNGGDAQRHDLLLSQRLAPMQREEPTHGKQDNIGFDGWVLKIRDNKFAKGRTVRPS